ncbi:hypothetical protein [Candidatus Poriferisocius sp.]|uniref:hypothetical protein n=1 Tax=Candidatus Poriferisocius sp. TaxID=3101276 RepID=UPI003B019A8E
MKLRRKGVVVLCIAGLLATASAGGSAGATGGGYQPAAGIADAVYSVPFYGRLWSDQVNDRVLSPQAAATQSANYFAQVAVTERDGSALDLSFAVEGQTDASEYQTCHPDEGCTDVTVRATPDGLLYLHTERDSPAGRVYYTHLGGFASRAVELSAADADSGLKVYREVAVDRSPAVAGCADYGDDTPEAFTCLFLRQLLPAGQAASADEAALRAKLPKLVQDSSNYRLVFAEEFNGTPPPADANGCRDGLSTLDPGVWNYFNACSNVDSRGEPCGNVGSGGYTMAEAGTCTPGVAGPFASSDLNTSGLLHMKYGYIEIEYTFNIDQWRWIYYNYTTLLNLRGHRLHELRDQYGVEIESWEDHLKHSGVELDIFEFSGGYDLGYQNFDVAHQYANWAVRDLPETLLPLQAQKWVDFCAIDGGQGIVANPGAIGNRCESTDSFTVTRGIEWTPRGYRTYIWVHGLQDGLTLIPKDKIGIQQLRDGKVRKAKKTRNQFFENLVPGDASTLLEKAGVAHVPLPLHLSTWGFMLPDRHPYIRQRMTVDYVRVWQPENHYTDMEPVYQ